MFLNFLISCRSPEFCRFSVLFTNMGVFHKYDSCGKPVDLRGWAGFLVPRHTCGAYVQLTSGHRGTTAQEVGHSATGCWLIYHWQRRSSSHENMHIKRIYTFAYTYIPFRSVPFHSIPFIHTCIYIYIEQMHIYIYTCVCFTYISIYIYISTCFNYIICTYMHIQWTM